MVELPLVNAIAIEGTNMLLTVMVTAALVTMVALAQGAFEVNMQVTKFPLTKEVLEKVGLFAPAFRPFNCH